ncbi:MAG: AraC family transcriptional regulator [Proteobacteria bacterium]|nr:AraC family transcriptional regulator [Pseudomonadota bacterium]
MRADAAPLLECLSVFHSRDADETGRFLGDIGFRFIVEGGRSRAPVDTRLNGAYFPSLWLGYTQYGPPVTIRTASRDDFWIQLPLRGGIEATNGRQVVACDARTAAVTSPTGERVIHADEGSARIQLSLTGPAMLRQLAALLGDWPREPLELAPAIDLTQGYGRSLAHYAHLAIAEFEANGQVRWTPPVISQFEQLFMTRLLLEHPHNYSHAVRRHERPISPRSVKRAIDYIDAHLDAPITVADLVAVSGVPGRTLFQNFHAFKGVSPIRYLRDQRFDRVRRALLGATPCETVTAIALRWGFAHMGRFAVEYRRRFGERPSATLAAGQRGAVDPRYAEAMQAQRAP